MMDTAQRHGEFIAGPAAERARLQVAKVMRIGWLATADERRLGDRTGVLAINDTAAARLRGHGLVVSGGLVAVGPRLFGPPAVRFATLIM